MNEQQLEAIEKRIEQADKNNMQIRSSCDEYACNCHFEITDLIAEIRRLKDMVHP